MRINKSATNRVWSIFSTVFLAVLLGTVAVFAGNGDEAKNGTENKGGGTDPGWTNPLPQTAPAPDILMRESFGMGLDFLRPAGGNGAAKRTGTGGTSINGFWVEYPGNKNNRWITPDSGETWRFCGSQPNPYELPSPLQSFPTEQNDILCNLLNASIDSPTRATALMPLLSNINTPWEIEINGHYWGAATNPFLAVGLTNSAVTTDNLATSGQVVLVMRRVNNPEADVAFEFRRGNLNGEILMSGTMPDDENFNSLKIRYNPQTREIGASFKGMDLGTFPSTIASPRYAAIEGIGFADNFVVRRLP